MEPTNGPWLTFLGTSMSTGPGRPLVAMCTASRTVRGMSAVSLTR